ncbi:hypothetical protein H6F96_07910 [Microcoleus sp. FACHB-53]|nr:hypothetical protein [Microcoleus sp. FACHB-53]MBD2130062.1 hypothetical protein [Microcoleus sp. FACHB-1]
MTSTICSSANLGLYSCRAWQLNSVQQLWEQLLNFPLRPFRVDVACMACKNEAETEQSVGNSSFPAL